jgi:hypothetical protein
LSVLYLQSLDCADDKACVSQVCQSVCAVQNPCAPNAICRAQFHRPLCVCPVGWAGNPQVRCYKRKFGKTMQIL